jgi:hypothetical protein
MELITHNVPELSVQPNPNLDAFENKIQRLWPTSMLLLPASSIHPSMF